MPRPRVHDENLRLRLLDRAAELISTEGPGALSLRRLAADTGTSTTAVYSLFGGKPALLEALFTEAFRRFGEYLAAVGRSADPLHDMLEIGLAYRRSALADPHLYKIMFGDPIPGFVPSAQARAESLRTLFPLLDAARRGTHAGLFADVPAERISYACWAQVHGAVSLQIDGAVPAELLRDTDSEATYRELIGRGIVGWLRTPATQDTTAQDTPAQGTAAQEHAAHSGPLP